MARNWSYRRAVLLVGASACLGAGPGAPSDGGPCPSPVGGTARCHTVTVPENHADPGGRSIELAVLVLPATGPATAEPIFFLAGGPGQSAISLAAMVAARHAGSRASRDLVFMDQRGTGGSHRLGCASGAAADPNRVLGPPYTEAELVACRRDLERRADLTQYTTEATVQDLEVVRERLGYSRINLAAGSYGTKVAFVYLRRFPSRLRAVVMEGIAPPSFRNPLPHSKGSQAALEAVFRDCAADAPCRARYPTPRADFDSAMARFRGGPIAVRPQGASREVALDRETFGWGLHLLLFSTQSAAMVPGILHRAAAGDFNGMATILASVFGSVAGQIDFGLQLSVTCTEDLPGLTPAEIERETAGTYLGAAVVTSMIEQCRSWPRGTVPTDFAEPVASDVPTLLIAGGLDPATPPAFAEVAVRTLSRGRLVTVPMGGHVTAHPCIDRMVAAFLASGSGDGLDVACAAELRRPPFQVF